jgi:hypothetical protein
MIHAANACRGEYIDLCAQVECWAVAVIRSAPAQASGKAGKMPHLLGQKLKLIGELADHDGVFVRPARIRELMAELEPLMKLRSDLAHARLLGKNDGAADIFAFELPTADAAPKMTGRFWLRRDETAVLIAALKKSHKELTDQKLKA